MTVAPHSKSNTNHNNGPASPVSCHDNRGTHTANDIDRRLRQPAERHFRFDGKETHFGWEEFYICSPQPIGTRPDGSMGQTHLESHRMEGCLIEPEGHTPACQLRLGRAEGPYGVCFVTTVRSPPNPHPDPYSPLPSPSTRCPLTPLSIAMPLPIHSL